MGLSEGKCWFLGGYAGFTSIKCACCEKNGKKQVRKSQKLVRNTYFLVKIGKKIGDFRLFWDVCFKNLRKWFEISVAVSG